VILFLLHAVEIYIVILAGYCGIMFGSDWPLGRINKTPAMQILTGVIIVIVIMAIGSMLINYIDGPLVTQHVY
jgi:hypothetical protein